MTTPADNLPPVEPPSTTFLMQLFVVPLTIVGVIVVVIMLINWLINQGSKPQELVDDLRKLNTGSWQKALTVANLLTDRRHDELRSDPKMAQQLATILDDQLKEGNQSPDRLKLRVYLCLALGVFEVDEGLPELIRAAKLENQPADLEVRKTALEAITRRAGISDEKRNALRENTDLREAITLAAVARSDDPNLAPLYAQLRERAAYLLGVLGGDSAQEQLAGLLADSEASVRFNAATGLARAGDRRSIPRLLDMIHYAEQPATEGMSKNDAEILIYEQTAVVGNGIRAATQMAQKHSPDQLPELRDALQELLSDKQLPAALRRGIESDLKIAQERFGLAP